MTRSLCVAVSLFLFVGVAQAQDKGVTPPTKTEAGVIPAPTVPVTPVLEVPTMPTGTPEDVGQAVDKVKEIISLGKAKNYWGMSAAIIFVILFILKLFGVFTKIGKRWSYLIVGFLSMATLLLSKFGAGLSWEAAIAVMTSGPFMAFASDFVKRGVLGQEPTTPINPTKK